MDKSIQGAQSLLVSLKKPGATASDNDVTSAKEALAEAVKSGNSEAIKLWRSVVELQTKLVTMAEQEAAKTKAKGDTTPAKVVIESTNSATTQTVNEGTTNRVTTVALPTTATTPDSPLPASNATQPSESVVQEKLEWVVTFPGFGSVNAVVDKPGASLLREIQRAQRSLQAK